MSSNADMRDGLYAVVTDQWVAGFIIRDGLLWDCAPILRRRFDHWRTVARYLG